jgi:hypothetical protein
MRPMHASRGLAKQQRQSMHSLGEDAGLLQAGILSCNCFSSAQTNVLTGTPIVNRLEDLYSLL